MEIIKQSGQFVPVRIDADKDKSIVKKYKVRAFPTIMFVDGKGKVLGKLVGVPTVKRLTEKMDEAARVFKELPELRSKFEADPTDLATGATLVTTYANSGNLSEAKKFLKKLEEADPEKAKPHLTASYLALGDAQLDTEEYDDAERYFKKAVGLAQDPADISDAYFGWASAFFEWRQKFETNSKGYQKKLKEAEDKLNTLLMMENIPQDRKDNATSLLKQVQDALAAIPTEKKKDEKSDKKKDEKPDRKKDERPDKKKDENPDGRP